MLYRCFFIVVLLIIGAIVLIVKNKGKEREKDNNYRGAKVISLFFPIIGLIIYAVNIGKNDNLARDCARWAIIGFIIGLITTIVSVVLVNM